MSTGVSAGYGEQLRKVRGSFDLTQEAFAKKVGISLSSLRRYEKDERQPTLETASQIAQALGLSLREFLMHDDSEGMRSYVWSAALDDRLKQIGYSIVYDEHNADMWLCYPDGSFLRVPEEDMKALLDNSDAYLRFLLEELRQRLTKHLMQDEPEEDGGD